MLFNVALSYLLTLSLNLHLVLAGSQPKTTCRNIPGSAGFPTTAEWAALNRTISGRLVAVVPFAKFCTTLPAGQCTPQQFTSSVFRNGVPGAMNYVNWEQDYDSSPPSLCQPASAASCGQGRVPLYAILAESTADVQGGVLFAKAHNLRLAIKASGHDFLGRSNAKNSLLISTQKLQSSVFTDNFVVGRTGFGPAVTLGSGVPLSKMYQLTKAQGKITVGGSASTVVAAGGYVQGAGHSAMSPTFGLAADNCLELNIVLASGKLVKANSVENPDLFWALRGGGAGSWGVIVSATFRTYPTFDTVNSVIVLRANSTEQAVKLSTVHAKHIFDWDQLRAGQYFYLTTSGTGPATMTLDTYFHNATLDQATAALQPFLDEVKTIGVTLLQQTIVRANINDVLFSADDIVGTNLAMGSRLVPASAYKDPELVGQVYSQLLNNGARGILGNLVAGGKVAENANIHSSVHPAWRTAKTHMILVNDWLDTATIDQIHERQTFFKRVQLPILEQLSGANAGAYSNEADYLEENFQSVFFGPNYTKLRLIKARYDPTSLFIVKGGVGSERWDNDGFCLI